MDSKKSMWSREQKGLYCFADSATLCRELLDGGARIIQLRAKNLDDRSFRKLALQMQGMIREVSGPAALIVNDRVEIAFAIGADGVHVGQDDSDYRQVIQGAPGGMIVGVSVGSVAEAVAAEEAGADYVGAGAVFPTPTKDDAELIGIDELQRIVGAVHIPVVAIGGISLKNVVQVRRAGAHFFAVISEINGAPDITARIREFEQIINE